MSGVFPADILRGVDGFRVDTSPTDIPEQLVQYAYAGRRTVGTVPCALVEYWTWTGVARRK